MSVCLPLLRWAARLSALLVTGAYTLLMIGEIASPHSGGPSTFLEWTGIALLTIAALAMLLAWRWELQPQGKAEIATQRETVSVFKKKAFRHCSDIDFISLPV